MLGPPAGVSPPSPHCARCGRRIGQHLAFAEPEDKRKGLPQPRRICYRCHRLATWGRLPPLLEDVEPANRARPTAFIMYRLAMILVAGMTLVFVRRTGNVGHFLVGLGGVILFFALSLTVRPGRRRSTPPRQGPVEHP